MLRTPRKIILTIMCCYFISMLSGCASTDETAEQPDCQPQVTENCESDEGPDRGYDPCLVNKNLPVCKT